MTQKILNIVSVVFSVLSMIFFIVGCIGYASTETTMKNVAWITADDHGNRFWSDLAGYRLETKTTMDETFIFGDCALGNADNESLCTKCMRDGNAAFALLIVATTFATVVSVFSGILIATPNIMMQLMSLFSSFVSAAFSLVGFGLFMGNCYWKFENYFDFNLHYGPGAIIVLLGLLMMWLTVFFQMGAVVVGAGK